MREQKYRRSCESEDNLAVTGQGRSDKTHWSLAHSLSYAYKSNHFVHARAKYFHITIIILLYLPYVISEPFLHFLSPIHIIFNLIIVSDMKYHHRSYATIHKNKYSIFISVLVASFVLAYQC